MSKLQNLVLLKSKVKDPSQSYGPKLRIKGYFNPKFDFRNNLYQQN
jgi:hypothetical protein